MKKPNENDAALLLRLPADLKAELQREADLSGRRITAEVNFRLRESLKKRGSLGTFDGGRDQRAVHEEPGEYPSKVETTSTERAMLQVFRSLPPEKQLALLSLFK